MRALVMSCIFLVVFSSFYFEWMDGWLLCEEVLCDQNGREKLLLCIVCLMSDSVNE